MPPDSVDTLSPDTHLARPDDVKLLAELRRLVITGELPPGEWISLTYLCRRLGCSLHRLRTPLRELSHLRLLVTAPHLGISVSPLSLTDFGRLVEAQALVSIPWIGLASQRINNHQVEQMRTIVSDQFTAAKAGELYQLAELDYEFHSQIAEATGNPILSDFARSLHSALARYAYAAYQAAQGKITGDAVAGHRQILEALAQRDSALAQQKLDQHIREGQQKIPDILQPKS